MPNETDGPEDELQLAPVHGGGGRNDSARVPDHNVSIIELQDNRVGHACQNCGSHTDEHGQQDEPDQKPGAKHAARAKPCGV